MINFIAFILIAIMAAVLGFIYGVLCLKSQIRQRCPEQWDAIEKNFKDMINEMKECTDNDDK